MLSKTLSQTGAIKFYPVHLNLGHDHTNSFIKLLILFHSVDNSEVQNAQRDALIDMVE